MGGVGGRGVKLGRWKAGASNPMWLGAAVVARRRRIQAGGSGRQGRQAAPGGGRGGRRLGSGGEAGAPPGREKEGVELGVGE